MHKFIEHNRAELIARCKAKVAKRPQRAATKLQLQNGIPLFLEQLRRTLQAEEDQEAVVSLRISGTSGNSQSEVSEMGVSAAAHGKQLLKLGFTVDQVVHDYGDLCQAITDLAVERDAPFAIDEFRTLNRCLDNAIADAVTEFSAVRDATLARQQTAEANERLSYLVLEMKTSLTTATLAMTALEIGSLPVTGATGTVLKRCLAVLSSLTDRSLADLRLANATSGERASLSVSALLSEAASSADVHKNLRNCTLQVLPVDPLLHVWGDRNLLLTALLNLLHNALKFSHPNTEVTLAAKAAGYVVSIEVADQCGGLPPGVAEHMFSPFSKRSSERTGVGLGLAIARQSVEAEGGIISVEDVPGIGCVFTISLPLHKQP